MGLLGKSYDPYGGMTSLLGIDQGAMRKQALFNGLAAAGFTLMGDRNPGNAGLAFVAGTDRARDDYMRAAMDAYRMKTAEEERAERRAERQEDRDWRQRQADESARRWEQEFGLRQKDAAWTNTERQRQLDEWGRADDMRAGQQDAVTGFMGYIDDYTRQGGDLFSPEMQMGLRQQGIQGVDPMAPRVTPQDRQKYQRMQPFVGAGMYPEAFQQMTAEPQAPDAPNVQTIYDPRTGQEQKVQWINRQWVPIGGAKAKSEGQQMRMTMPDGTEVVVGSGGSASLPGELGARIGLGQKFLETDFSAIIKDIEAGKATGPVDYAMGALGRGKSGNVQRRMASGVDALRRNLTGAGMAQSEAADYANRYLPQWSDDADTLAKKAMSLKADLEAVRDGAIMGKTGNLQMLLPGSQMFGPGADAAPAAPTEAPAPSDDYNLTPDAIPENTPVEGEDGQIYKRRNGKMYRFNGQGWDAVQ